MVSKRWFALADLFLTVCAVILLAAAPGLGGFPMILAAFPWLVRAASGRFPFRRTRYDLLLLVFAITAAVGVWAAYNPVDAWRKFWMLGAGIFLFYALAGQPEENRWWLAGFSILVGTSSALFFLLANDWHVFPAKIGLITQVGVWLMGHRPNLFAGLVNAYDFADITAGMIAYTVPFLLAFGIKAWKQKNIVGLFVFGLCGLLNGAGFVLAISRAATIALAAGLAAWAVWAVLDQARPAMRSILAKRKLPITGIVALLAGGLAFFLCGGPGLIARALVNFYADSGRLSVAVGTLQLIGDFLITGGGLGSFPGLYSVYVLFVPDIFLNNSHNLFLDIGLEQGVIAMVAFVLIYLGSVQFSLAAQREPNLLLQAAFASLFIVLTQGLVDDIVYGSNSASLVFLFPGIACSLAQPNVIQTSGQRLPTAQFFNRSALAGAALVMVLLALNWNAVVASWYANLGAVQLAKMELVTFPLPQQEASPPRQEPTAAVSFFRSALESNPNQRTAGQRMKAIFGGSAGDPAALVVPGSLFNGYMDIGQ